VAGSARSLADKLGVAPGLTVYVDGGPPHVGDLLDGATYRTRLPRRIDLTLLFVTDVARLRRRLPVVLERTTTGGAVWVCWPKKASGVPTEVDDAVVRGAGLAARGGRRQGRGDRRDLVRAQARPPAPRPVATVRAHPLGRTTGRDRARPCRRRGAG